MASRLCLDCGALTGATRCQACESKRNQAKWKARNKSNLYNNKHRKQREAWAVAIHQEGNVKCWICDRTLEVTDFDLDHAAQPLFGISLPAHSRCNRGRRHLLSGWPSDSTLPPPSCTHDDRHEW